MKYPFTSIGKVITCVIYPVMIFFIFTVLTATDWFVANLLLLVPTLVNGLLLFSFGSTLVYPPTVIEKIARTMTNDLSENEVLYCKNVTVVWCLFFTLNGSMALFLAFFYSIEVWTLYNGVIAYGLMGLLFLVEFFYRHWRFRRFVGTPLDPLLRRIFPPHASNAN
jgi:uncharacterized membrane protein